MIEHQHRIRVRYAETDAMGVAHHAAYLPWLEEARIEALRSLGHPYRELEAAGLFMPVTEVSLAYRKALHFDDELGLTTRVEVAGPGRLRFATAIVRADEVCAEGSVTIACINRDGRPQRLPADLVARLKEA